MITSDGILDEHWSSSYAHVYAHCNDGHNIYVEYNDPDGKLYSKACREIIKLTTKYWDDNNPNIIGVDVC